MDEYLISIIIPVYNCQFFLRDSIQSLLNQSIFDKLEFIFVDDGSTDKSYAIISEYEKSYRNFVLQHQENLGVSAARNNGIKLARGKYISFFDADDIAQPRLYEKLYNLLVEFDADISIVDYSMVFDDGKKKKHRINVKKKWGGSEEAMIDFFSTNLICTNPVDKMFKADIVKSIAYPDGYAIGEDMHYVYNALKRSKCVVLDSSESLYNYVLHSNSAMKQKFSDKHFDAVRLAQIIANDCKESTIVYPYAYANYIHETCKMLELMYRSNAEKLYSDNVKSALCEIRRYNLSDAKTYMSKKHFVGLLLMRLSPSLYCAIYRILKIG